MVEWNHFFKVLVNIWIFNPKTLSINYGIISYSCSMCTKVNKVEVFCIMPTSPGKHYHKNNAQLPLHQVAIFPSLSQHDLPILPAHHVHPGSTSLVPVLPFDYLIHLFIPFSFNNLY